MNYLIRLFLICNILNLFSIHAVSANNYAPYPVPDSGYVTDKAGLLTYDEEEQVEKLLWQVERKTNVEIVVVTIGAMKDYAGNAASFESFSQGMFNTYGVGNTQANDGVLLLVSRDDRKARIQLGAGYPASRDRDAQKIMQRMIVPAFKQGEYNTGIINGTREIADKFAGYEVQNKAVSAEGYAPYPTPDSGYVTDKAGLLTYDEEEQIEQVLWQVESKTDVEIIVVTISAMRDYVNNGRVSIESFAEGMFDTYGIGNQPANNGVLLLVSKSDREARIALGAGYSFTRNSDAQKIMHEVIVPAFREGEYNTGIIEGTNAIAEEFAGVRIGFPWTVAAFIGGGVLLVLFGYSLIRNGKRGWGWVFVGIGIILLLFGIYLFIEMMKHRADSDSSSWDAGGLGGFGGGSSDGGGASGSW